MFKDKIALNIKLTRKENRCCLNVVRVELLETTYFENILLTDLFPEYGLGYVNLKDVRIDDMNLFRVFCHYIAENQDSGRDGFSSINDIILQIIRYKKAVKINNKIYLYKDIEHILNQ